MAKKIDTSNLSVDYKQLMRMTVQDRVGLAKSGLGEELMRSLTPTQLALAFPKYYARQLPDIGRVITGGGAAPTYGGGTAPSYGGGRPSQTAAPVPSAPSGRQNPQLSSTAKQNQQNDFIKHLESIAGKKGQQTFSSSTGFGIDRSRFKSELENNPELAQQIMSLAKAEVGSQGPAAQQKWMETIFNRAYAQGKSVASIIDPNNGYWPKGQKRPQISKAENDLYMGTLNRVLSGSNESNYATDNASAGLAKRREQSGRKGSRESGEFFYIDFHYQKAMEKLRKETEQRAMERATDVSSQDASKSQKATNENLRTLSPKDVTSENSKQIIGEAAKGNKSIGSRVLDRALQLEGMNEIENRQTIQKYLKNGGQGVDPALTPWCADFINATLAQEGIKGTKSAVATSFSTWGLGVEPSKVQKGDVLVEHRGRPAGATGGHVGFATGETRINPRTGAFEIEMYGGNQGVKGRGYIAANKKWVTASSLFVRRSPEAVEEEKSGITPQYESKDIVKPKNYDFWNDNVKKYIDKLTPSEQKKIFETYNKIQEQGIPFDINQEFEKWSQTSSAENVAKGLVKAVENTPASNLEGLYNNIDEELKYGFWKEGSTPTPEERKQVFEKGGVVVNLDTNWAKKGQQTGPMIVIPDNATKEQRKQAQAYVRQIEEVYKEKFGKSLPGKVVTRSENQRVRQSTIHSEPFSVNDDKAVEYFTRTDEGRAKLANITANTLGKIPGVQFSLPHDPYKPMKPDYGAVGAMGSEVDLARVLINDLKQKQIIQQEAAKEKAVRETQLPATQTQQDQAPVPVEAVATPSSQQLESQKPTGQQGQGASISPTRAGVSASPIKQPTATPEGYRTLEQRPTDTAGPAQKLPDTGTTEAQKVNLEQSAPPTEPGKYGGGEITDLRPNEDAYVVQAKTGQVVAQMNSKQEILAGNEVIPTRRIDNIRTEMQNDSRNIQQEQPQQQSNQPVASMTPSTQMTQAQPNMYNDTNQIYGGMIGSIYDKPASVDAAYRMARLQSNPTRENIDVGNIGYSTLT